MTRMIGFLTKEYSFDFIRLRWAAFALSFAACVAAVALLAVKGLSYGIDFEGGLLIEARSEAGFAVDDVRSRLKEIGGEIDIQAIGSDGKEVMIRVLNESDDDKAQKMLSDIKDSLGDNTEYRRVEMVGPRIGGELKSDSILASVCAVLVIALYVWFRFEWQFAVGALLSLSHDALVTLGLLALFDVAFDLTTVAAILTLIGYSINDTVVLYDRVRENLKKHRRMDMKGLINKSINDNIARTVLTGITTLIASAILLFMGGDSLFGFAFVLFFGILIGTYSSVYVATPMMYLFNLKKTIEAKENV